MVKRYITEPGDTIDGIAFKLGYNGQSDALLGEGDNVGGVIHALVRGMALPPGVELDLPGDWEQPQGNQLWPTAVYNPDTHAPPSLGQAPQPLPPDQRKASSAAPSPGPASALAPSAAPVQGGAATQSATGGPPGAVSAADAPGATQTAPGAPPAGPSNPGRVGGPPELGGVPA